MKDELLQAAWSIKPVPLQEYLRSRGWRTVPGDFQTGVAPYVNDEHPGIVLDILNDTSFADYGKRVVETLSLLADIEEKSPLALAEEINQPAGDVLDVRVDSEKTRSFTLPLVDSLRLREGAKNLLLAAAHSAISPQGYFPRMSRAEATQLLASVREGQNRGGSFIARFIVPVEPSIGAQPPLFEEEPFSRRVVKLLMQALDNVHRVRSLGAYDELLSMEGEGVSGNLLAALSLMRGSIDGGSVELSVSWARNRRQPEHSVSRVRFSAETLDGLDVVADRMRDLTQTKAFQLEGWVARLAREPASGPDAPGDIVLVPSGDDTKELRRVYVHLDGEAYAEAIRAHQNENLVQVVGTLRKEGRRWVLSDAAGFEVVGPPNGIRVEGQDELGRD